MQCFSFIYVSNQRAGDLQEQRKQQSMERGNEGNQEIGSCADLVQEER